MYALETLTQDPKINKVRTLANLLESHASHAIQFFVTVSTQHSKTDRPKHFTFITLFSVM